MARLFFVVVCSVKNEEAWNQMNGNDMAGTAKEQQIWIAAALPRLVLS
jgi:hypothetical protein